MPEHPDSPVKLPNLNVVLVDKLACMLQRGGVIGRHEVIAPNDLAPRSYYERSIVHHARPIPMFRFSNRSCARASIKQCVADAHFGDAKRFRKIGRVGAKKKPRREPGQGRYEAPRFQRGAGGGSSGPCRALSEAGYQAARECDARLMFKPPDSTAFALNAIGQR